jgi:hypothetical protein
LPQIKPEGFIKNKAHAPVNIKFINGLIKMFVINLDNGLLYVNSEILGKWKKTLNEINDVAIKNLENKPEKEIIAYCLQSKVKDSVVCCNIRGNEFTASLVACPKKLLAIAQKNGLQLDKLTMGIPSREEIILLEPNAKIEIIQKMIDEAYNKAVYKVSNKLFELSSSGNIKELEETK